MGTTAAVTDRAPAEGPPDDGASTTGRRRRLTVAAEAALGVVAAVALAVAVGSAVGSSDSGDTLETPPSGSAGAGSDDGPVTESTAGPVQDGHEVGFVRDLVDGAGGTTVVVDRALFLSGDEADAASAARGWDSPVPNDVLVLDDDRTLREYPVSPDAIVRLSVGLAPVEATQMPVDSSLAELRRLLPPSSGEPTAPASGTCSTWEWRTARSWG